MVRRRVGWSRELADPDRVVARQHQHAEGGEAVGDWTVFADQRIEQAWLHLGGQIRVLRDLRGLVCLDIGVGDTPRADIPSDDAVEGEPRVGALHAQLWLGGVTEDDAIATRARLGEGLEDRESVHRLRVVIEPTIATVLERGDGVGELPAGIVEFHHHRARHEVRELREGVLAPVEQAAVGEDVH